jgi:hypothetical protein
MKRTKPYNNRGTLNITVPIQFHIGSVKLNWQMVQKHDTVLFAGTWFTGITMESIRLGDGWELVRRFLSVPTENEKSVLEFLSAHGRFEPPPGSTTGGVGITDLPVRSVWRGEFNSKHVPTEMVVESFACRDFATIQSHVRRMLIAGNPTLSTPWRPNEIQRYEIAFANDRSDTKAHVIVGETFPAILATVQFKLVQGAKFKICARKDCRLPFEVTSLHERRFCTQYCAHITSLRQRRKEGAITKKRTSTEE